MMMQGSEVSQSLVDPPNNRNVMALQSPYPHPQHPQHQESFVPISENHAHANSHSTNAGDRASFSQHISAKIQSALLLVFVLCSPLVIYGFSSQTGFGFNLRFSRLAMIAALTALIVRGMTAKDLQLKWTTFDWLLVTYTALNAFSGIIMTAWAPFKVRFFGLLESIAIYYLTRLSITSILDCRRILKFYLLSAVPVLLIGVHQVWTVYHGTYKGPLFLDFVMLDKYSRLLDPNAWMTWSKWTRLSSTFGEPNMTGGFLAAALPFTIHFALENFSAHQIKRTILWLLILGSLCVGVVATGSKSAFVSSLAGLGFFFRGLLSGSDHSQRIKRYAWGFIAAIAAITIAYGFISSEFLLQRASALDNGHFRDRLAALQVVWQHPLFGVGYANYGSTHTTLLTSLVETGLIGGVIVLIWLGEPFYHWWKATSASHSPSQWSHDEKRLGLALMSGFSSVLVGLYLYDYLLYPFVWIIFALVIEYQNHLAEHDGSNNRNKEAQRPGHL